MKPLIALAISLISSVSFAASAQKIKVQLSLLERSSRISLSTSNINVELNGQPQIVQLRHKSEAYKVTVVGRSVQINDTKSSRRYEITVRSSDDKEVSYLTVTAKTEVSSGVSFIGSASKDPRLLMFTVANDSK